MKRRRIVDGCKKFETLCVILLLKELGMNLDLDFRNRGTSVKCIM